MTRIYVPLVVLSPLEPPEVAPELAQGARRDAARDDDIGEDGAAFDHAEDGRGHLAACLLRRKAAPRGELLDFFRIEHVMPAFVADRREGAFALQVPHAVSCDAQALRDVRAGHASARGAARAGAVHPWIGGHAGDPSA